MDTIFVLHPSYGFIGHMLIVSKLLSARRCVNALCDMSELKLYQIVVAFFPGVVAHGAEHPVTALPRLSDKGPERREGAFPHPSSAPGQEGRLPHRHVNWYFASASELHHARRRSPRTCRAKG